MAAKSRSLEHRQFTSPVRCANGVLGIYSEEIWLDSSGAVVKYNLAFINHGFYNKDNGRVLGYDNAHGVHERHWMGQREPFTFTSYAAVAARFASEVAALRKKER